LLDMGSAASLTLGAIPWSMMFIALIHLTIQVVELDSMTIGSRAPANVRPRTI